MYYRLVIDWNTRVYNIICTFGVPFYASSVPLKAENVTSGYVITGVPDGRLERFGRLVGAPDGIQRIRTLVQRDTPYDLFVCHFTPLSASKGKKL